MSNYPGFSNPQWTPTRWLLGVGPGVPQEIRSALVRTLYGTLPIFAGGVSNTIAVALLIAARHPQSSFRLWLLAEIVLAVLRLMTLITDRKAAAAGRRTFTDFYIWLGVAWAASIGYGTCITVMSGDWIAISLVCLSTAAMAGGICFRNFGAPRLVATMILLSMGPCAIAMVASGIPLLLIVALQIPFYLVSMTIAAFRLNRMLVATMCAERDNDRRARHDTLTGLLNRSGLEQCFEQDRADVRSLFYIDLDGFKPVNDALGHAAGDQLLKQVAECLCRTAGEDAHIARIGGDEFIILLPVSNPASAHRLGQTIVRAIAGQRFQLGSEQVSIGASIGIAIDLDAAAGLDALMGRADKQLYLAKSSGGGCSIARNALPGLQLVRSGRVASSH